MNDVFLARGGSYIATRVKKRDLRDLLETMVIAFGLPATRSFVVEQRNHYLAFTFADPDHDAASPSFRMAKWLDGWLVGTDDEDLELRRTEIRMMDEA